MSLSPNAHAVKVMLDHIAKESLDRIAKWFDENPDEPYCYWAKDKFLSISQRNDPEYMKVFMCEHPEIGDIDDHTIVEYDKSSQTTCLSRFCPTLKAALKELYDSGCTGNTFDGVKYEIIPDGDNYKVTAYEEN